MPKLFRKTRERFVAYCERCLTVCDAACRAERIREHARRQSLAYGWRQV